MNVRSFGTSNLNWVGSINSSLNFIFWASPNDHLANARKSRGVAIFCGLLIPVVHEV